MRSEEDTCRVGVEVWGKERFQNNVKEGLAEWIVLLPSLPQALPWKCCL